MQIGNLSNSHKTAANAGGGGAGAGGVRNCEPGRRIMLGLHNRRCANRYLRPAWPSPPPAAYHHHSGKSVYLAAAAAVIELLAHAAHYARPARRMR